ncbi:MAG: hypothetical protein HQ561_10940 [Desulfobacteraceae bacterium]|nr:hypothetical protein [Desulfobacteraceae bacterium]
MDEEAILSHLEALAHSLGIKVRYEDLEGEATFSAGGLCRIRNQQVIIVNKWAPTREKTRTLAKALSRFDLNQVYIRPALRDFLEEARGAKD